MLSTVHIYCRMPLKHSVALHDAVLKGYTELRYMTYYRRRASIATHKPPFVELPLVMYTVHCTLYSTWPVGAGGELGVFALESPRESWQPVFRSFLPACADTVGFLQGPLPEPCARLPVSAGPAPWSGARSSRRLSVSSARSSPAKSQANTTQKGPCRPAG